MGSASAANPSAAQPGGNAVKPFSFRQLRQGERLVAEELLDAPRAGYLSLDDMAFKFEPTTAKKQTESVFCVQLKVGPSLVWLEIPRAIADPLIGQQFEQLIPAGLAPAIEAMMFEQALQPLFQHFEGVLGQEVECRRFETAEDFNARFAAALAGKLKGDYLPCALVVTSKTVAKPSLMRLVIEPQWVSLLQRALPRLTRELSARMLQLRAAVPVVLGVTRLGADDLHSLQPGDVVLMDSSLLTQQRVGVLSPIKAWVASVDQLNLTLEEGDFPLMSEQSDASVANVKNVPVDVQFRVGNLQMTVEQIAQMVKGQVLNLGRPITGPVELVVAGSVVGSGQLVEIEGQVGVRITETAAQ
ncbi:MAG: type III secretion system cytoplasmic ring protein SctQ [Gammaproteobacteria bacterium]|nr:type III secretion system cytoplasmic ring protein SctQ [Gammaproteobacteria bacterium]